MSCSLVNAQLTWIQCDEQVPACSNCRRNGIVCLVEDPATKRQQPRNYLEILEQRVELLEGMLRELQPSSASESSASPNTLAPAGNHQPSTATADEDHHDLSDLSSMVGTLSINAAGAEPHYLGPSSVFAFTRFIKPSLHQAISSITPTQDHHNLSTPEPCPLPDYPTAVRLSNAYFQNIHTQYPFLHEPTFRMWETALEDPLEAMSILNFDPVPLYFLNMVYAVGALLLPTIGYSPEQLYASALLYIDDILCRDNLEAIQAILCSAAYSLRSSKGTSQWKLAGLAVRHCVTLGYHRNQKRFRSSVSPLQQELQKRTFWSAYEMECSAAVMLGRPLCLHFQEIDAELPLDIEESRITSTGICGSPRSSPTDPPTMMTYANHAFRIRALQGCIQTALYSDTALKDPAVRKTRVQELLMELKEWQTSNPPPIVPPAGGGLSIFMTPDWYQINYNYAILQLYRVEITDSKEPASDDVFVICLEAAKSTCHSYRRQFFGKPTTYTWAALHELFLAGLTYLYCLWTSPAAREASRHDQVSSACTDCTMVLVILAERWSDAAPYRDIFEALASRTMTMMADTQQGKEIASTALVPGQDYYPEDLPQWMEGITDTGISLGVDLLLSGLIDDFPSREQYDYGDGGWG
ncbi:fungal-specific transcription factor domain-containing protein [Dactylonectria estremocensis]|uniref:Fungal-specific transcription factor domain-containing protein n=1 Tax=Dactylonectria estremocensis TaxID=1079267 RepID=A0A9P9JAJ6_9HYPO|nr:fungal-specific transcription factor domain-containing protein [Dactylonectria estremocensis]